MTLPFYWVDAFTTHVGRGNPAGLVPLARWLPDATMQAIATQNGLAETAFFVRTGDTTWHLRWFTPAYEIDRCGHATLAAAHCLLNELRVAVPAVHFDTRSGRLTVTRAPGNRLALDFPSRPATPLAPSAIPPDLSTGLGHIALPWVGRSRDLMVVLDTAYAVRAVSPDFTALRRLDVTGIIITAPGDHDCDFVSRFFAPGAGVPEDPVTGSAHCTLVPCWAERLGKTSLHARQVSPRGGDLWCELHGDRVTLAGQAATYLRGTIEAIS